MDVVYPIGAVKPELRYSLRSLTNIAHDRVWVVGETKPDWAQVEHLHIRNGRGKTHSLWNVFAAVAECDDITEEFIYMNDDFFALKPAPIPVWYRGFLRLGEIRRDRLRFVSWPSSCRLTGWHLENTGYESKNYEVHVPMVFNRKALAETIRFGASQPYLQVRSLYANHHRIGGTLHRDVKIGNPRDIPDKKWNSTFCSTSDNSFASGAVGRWIRERFPDPSPYEGEPMPDMTVYTGRVVARRVRRDGKPNMLKLDTGQWVREDCYLAESS